MFDKSGLLQFVWSASCLKRLLEANYATCKRSALPELPPNAAYSLQELFYMTFPDGSETWVSAAQLDSLLPQTSSTSSLKQPDLAVCAVHAAPSPTHAGPLL